MHTEILLTLDFTNYSLGIDVENDIYDATVRYALTTGLRKLIKCEIQLAKNINDNSDTTDIITQIAKYEKVIALCENLDFTVSITNTIALVSLKFDYPHSADDIIAIINEIVMQHTYDAATKHHQILKDYHNNWSHILRNSTHILK